MDTHTHKQFNPLWGLLLLLVLWACQGSSSQTDPKEAIPSSQEALDVSTKEVAPDSVAPLSPTENDEKAVANQPIIYDTTLFSHSDDHPAKILTIGAFHEDEVWADAAQADWWGVFKSGDEYQLTRTTLQTTRAYDPIVDSDSTKPTGWEVRTIPADTAILLMSGLDILEERKLTAIPLPQKSVLPGDTLTFDYLGQRYQLYATGIKKKVSENPVWYEIINYKLFLSTTLEGQQIAQLLMASPGFDETMVKILFMGDIDGDRRLDLIIDTSDHYNAMQPTLYLSKLAGARQLVKVAGLHRTTGC